LKRETVGAQQQDLPYVQVRSCILREVRAAEHLLDRSRRVLTLWSHSGAEVTLKLSWRNILLFPRHVDLAHCTGRACSTVLLTDR